MAVRPNLCDLPAEIISIIFSHLDYSDLWNCKFLNKRLYELTREEKHWQKLCRKYWLQTSRPYNHTWEDLFIHWFRDMGAYIDCYAHMKQTWDRIISYFKINCPLIYQTIKEGASEDELNRVEDILGLGRLPNDFRCSYRIHNGQRLTSPGIMGSMSIPGHYRSESLLDLDTIIVGFREREGVGGCIPLTLCLHSGLTQYLAITDADGYEPDTIFYPIQSEPVNGQKYMDAFISGTSFKDWLTSLADHLDNNDFPILQDQPFRFVHDPAAEETTNYITVSVATCFLPEISKIRPPKFFHTYRITMSMSPEAPQSEACQLETRHWIITDDNGSEEQVDGPGVVGEYPVMYPGANFSWVSSTSFTTTYGNMKGYFRMRNLQTSERSEVKCPVFHMKCQPYIIGEEREACKKRRSSDSDD
ncbi:f-box only protein 3 [Trichonephila inaurata madagascariensis]|uniref:F-box only protein 3 n=2 Tax=Trichonephila inaurata madagascariensis TaxID=2747483 RepID=A0A8X6Y0H9_9ARAC|nr:f-box only protein 3 [Trichonephila inaurata madagascariensis]